MAEIYSKALADIGHKVIFVTLCGENGDKVIRRNHLYLRQSRSLSATPRLVRLISRLNPDVVLGFQFQVNIILSLIALISFRRKWKFILRESNLQNYMSEAFSHRLKVRFMYIMADEIIAQCLDMQGHIIRHFNVNKSKISVIYNFPEYWERDAVSRRNILLVASNLSEQKNIIGALDKWELQGFEEEFHIYGYDSVRLEKLKNYIAHRGIPNVVFKGLVERVPYESYKLLFVTSNFEGFSNSVLESLSCGTPVLARNYEGGISEVVDDTNGIIFNMSEHVDIGAIANKRWNYDKIIKNVKDAYNKDQFKLSCEGVFS